MADLKQVPKDKLAKFELTEDTLNSFRKNNSIPFDLYNRNGQIIIPKKKNPSQDDFAKLLRFELQGVYFLLAELQKTKISVAAANAEGKSNVKLFDPKKVEDFAKQSAALLDDLKKHSFTSDQAIIVQNSVNEILNDFTSNPDFESGIFNILEILSVAGVSLQSELMTKRTIVAMGMKVRTKKIVSDADKKPYHKEHLALMMASYLADVGYAKLDITENPKLSKEEYAIIQQHPIISYLMSLSAPEISTDVRTLILNHHRPFRGAGVNNNFPDPRIVFQKLMSIRDMYSKETNRERIVEDIEMQLHLQENQITTANREDDIAILSLASEYASLTSAQAWRPAYSSAKALKMIVNDSFFSYSSKNIRHLIDYVGASLTNNENIINADDFIITASVDSEKQVHFDICKVIEVDRYQTRPKLQRICTIKPIFKKANKYRIADFDLSQVRMDRRKAIIDLSSHAAGSTRVIYIIDPEMNAPLFEAVGKLSKAAV
ncbi:HD-GYP domain-containing protein [Leptospira ryugenii]|uniref:HD-GYP domain-containing protein n=1 Tax=Leptospira ryugenii TaxID=1917863 RepID=A0A2P2DVF1_9LEPT|nr:c-di-GMP phosphodiesterase [Leptospira ryugenii]GBF48583.1 HD-GYP domain-containing protein [Leptospira ryugenii]